MENHAAEASTLEALNWGLGFSVYDTGFRVEGGKPNFVRAESYLSCGLNSLKGVTYSIIMGVFWGIY